MALNDNPLNNLHPIFQAMYADLLARLTTVQGLFSGVNSELAKRLRKDQNDSTQFNLSVAAAADMTDAVRKSELVNGIVRPFRNFKNVSVTPVGASVRAGQDAQIVPLLTGQVYSITNIRIKTLTSPTSASTITIKAGTTTIFTTNVSLLNVPVVGKILDLLTLAPAMPADVALPAIFTCSATSGTFDILVDGLLL